MSTALGGDARVGWRKTIVGLAELGRARHVRRIQAHAGARPCNLHDVLRVRRTCIPHDGVRAFPQALESVVVGSVLRDDARSLDGGELFAVGALHSVKGGYGVPDALLQGAQCGQQVVDLRGGQLGAGHRAGDGIDIDTDRGRPEARGFDNRGAPADERVEDREALEVCRLVVRLPEVSRRLRDSSDENGSERAPRRRANRLWIWSMGRGRRPSRVAKRTRSPNGSVPASRRFRSEIRARSI